MHSLLASLLWGFYPSRGRRASTPAGIASNHPTTLGIYPRSDCFWSKSTSTRCHRSQTKEQDESLTLTNILHSLYHHRIYASVHAPEPPTLQQIILHQTRSCASIAVSLELAASADCPWSVTSQSSTLLNANLDLESPQSREESSLDSHVRVHVFSPLSEEDEGESFAPQLSPLPEKIPPSRHVPFPPTDDDDHRLPGELDACQDITSSPHLDCGSLSLSVSIFPANEELLDFNLPQDHESNWSDALQNVLLSPILDKNAYELSPLPQIEKQDIFHPSSDLPAALAPEPPQLPDSPPSRFTAELGRDKHSVMYSLVGKIGSGGTAEVYKYTRNEEDSSSKVVALKVYHSRNAMDDEVTFLKMVREASRVGHGKAFVIQAIDIPKPKERGKVPVPGMLYLVLPWYTEDLNGLLARLRERSRCDEEVGADTHLTLFVYAAEIISAIDFIHTQCHLAHRDLKPANILISSTKHICLTDFGLARGILKDKNGQITTRVGCGTEMYASPETRSWSLVEDGVGVALVPMDVWGWGVTCIEMLTLVLLWPGEIDWLDILREHKSVLSKDAYDLLCQTVSPNPEDRPSVQSIKEHRYFDLIERLGWDCLDEAAGRPLEEFLCQLRDWTDE